MGVMFAGCVDWLDCPSPSLLCIEMKYVALLQSSAALLC